MPTPREEIKELIRVELDDAMRHSYSDLKVDRIAPLRADKTADKIIEVLRKAMQ